MMSANIYRYTRHPQRESRELARSAAWNNTSRRSKRKKRGSETHALLCALSVIFKKKSLTAVTHRERYKQPQPFLSSENLCTVPKKTNKNCHTAYMYAYGAVRVPHGYTILCKKHLFIITFF